MLILFKKKIQKVIRGLPQLVKTILTVYKRYEKNNLLYNSNNKKLIKKIILTPLENKIKRANTP
jgi:hypothetical protein